MKSTSPSNLIVVEEGVNTAGAIAWWRLSGTVDAARLETNWKAAGLDVKLLPETPAASTALRRAVMEQREARRLVRPLEGSKGFAIVEESAKGDNLDYQVTFRARVDAVGRVVIDPPPAGTSSHSPRAYARWTELRDEVLASVKRHESELSGQDVSSWLVGLMSRVDGVSLRDTGGIYFVPRHQIEPWRRMANALRASSSHAVFEVPALRSDEAVDAILDAVNVEAATEAATMEAELSPDAERQLGARALEGRMARCESVEKKVERYEALLGRRLDNMRERLEGLRANLAVAIVKANQETDGVSLGDI